MKLIVGLGNPGVRYENTRHNAGFMVMDKLIEKAGSPALKEKFEALYAKVRIKGEDVILLKPETFMNNSGFALRACMDYFKIDPEDVLVIYDDMDTSVGDIRLKPKGSAGGHNGMKSVIKMMMTSEFSRIRVGIGRDPQIPIIKYVLTKFKPEEKGDLQKAVDQAAEAAWYFVDHPFSQVMNIYNPRKKGKESHEQKRTAPEAG